MPRKQSSAKSADGKQKIATRMPVQDLRVRLRPWYAWIVLAVALLTYSNTLRHALVWDDLAAIKENPLVERLDVRGIFTTAYWYPDPKLTDLYRPVTVLSFAINHRIGGFQPAVYHLTNVVLHGLISLLLFFLLAKITGRLAFALTASLIFAVHPVHVEAVAWVSGRSELLACLFMLLAWRVSLPGKSGITSPAAIAGTGLLYLLALLSKESALVLLPVVWCFRAVQTSPAGRAGSVPAAVWRRFFRPVDAAFIAATVVMLVARLALLGQIGPKTTDTVPFVENPLAYLPAATRILTAIKLYGLYLWKMIWPLHLSSDYSFAEIPVATLADPWVWISLILAGICLFAVYRIGISSWILAGILAFVAGLTMVVQLLFPTGTLFAERLAYFPLIGYAVALVAALDHQATRRVLHGSGPVLLAALLSFFFLRSLRRNLDWKDPETVFLTMAANAPQSAKAQTLAGTVVAERDPAAARDFFEKSLRIYPAYPQAKLGLAQAEINTGHFLKAERILIEALQQPADPRESVHWKGEWETTALQALATAYRGSQKFDRALAVSEQILAKSPADAFAMQERAMALEGLHRNSEALGAYQKAIAAGADNAELRNRLGGIYLRAGDTEAALQQLLQARKMLPSYALTYFNLADIYRQVGDREHEREAYVEFLRYWRGSPRVAATIRSRLQALQ